MLSNNIFLLKYNIFKIIHYHYFGNNTILKGLRLEMWKQMKKLIQRSLYFKPHPKTLKPHPKTLKTKQKRTHFGRSGGTGFIALVCELGWFEYSWAAYLRFRSIVIFTLGICFLYVFLASSLLYISQPHLFLRTIFDHFFPQSFPISQPSISLGCMRNVPPLLQF